MKSKLDKFYTHPDIAKKFVDTINKLSPLEKYDMVLEPSAGCGNILKLLPHDAVGIDLAPEASNILEQDFFEYESPFHPLLNNISIATVGNPPFGSGYMNPLAKAFFNHAAKFSDLICFIVPAKWHNSWKVHFQLDKDFGLYYSEILPKNSFILDGDPYDVNCCMQVWSRKQLGTLDDKRITTRPPTTHKDFEMFLTCDNVPNLPKVREQIKNNEYWEFGLKYWGKIYVCDITEVPENTTTHYVFKPNVPYVKEVIESIDWTKYVSNMGAPNIGGKSIVVKAYTDRKKEMFGIS